MEGNLVKLVDKTINICSLQGLLLGETVLEKMWCFNVPKLHFNYSPFHSGGLGIIFDHLGILNSWHFNPIGGDTCHVFLFLKYFSLNCV